MTAKKHNPEGNVILQRHTTSPGRGVTCHRWRWVSVDTGQVLETTTDATMRNWHNKGWEALSQDRQPWGVYTNIHQDMSRETKQGVDVANADHQPILQHRLTEAEAAWMIKEINKPSSNFDSLFDKGDE